MSIKQLSVYKKRDKIIDFLVKHALPSNARGNRGGLFPKARGHRGNLPTWQFYYETHREAFITKKHAPFWW